MTAMFKHPFNFQQKYQSTFKSMLNYFNKCNSDIAVTEIFSKSDGIDDVLLGFDFNAGKKQLVELFLTIAGYHIEYKGEAPTGIGQTKKELEINGIRIIFFKNNNPS